VRIKAGPVGIRGLALLAAAGIAGLILGMHGWSARRTGLAVFAPLAVRLYRRKALR
jgi:hypothetical protein